MAEKLSGNHWTKEAACNFDAKFLSFDIEVVKECKAICENCPVQFECIQWLAEMDGHFISAGLSKYDRLNLQWKRVETVEESNFRGSEYYISDVVRRVRKTLYS